MQKNDKDFITYLKISRSHFTRNDNQLILWRDTEDTNQTLVENCGFREVMYFLQHTLQLKKLQQHEHYLYKVLI